MCVCIYACVRQWQITFSITCGISSFIQSIVQNVSPHRLYTLPIHSAFVTHTPRGTNCASLRFLWYLATILVCWSALIAWFVHTKILKFYAAADVYVFVCLCVRVYLPFAIIICKQGAYRLSSLPQWTTFMSVECLKINFFSNIIIIFALRICAL